jgi:antitoxin component HigA of HigAB toxin-antitoxin module
MTNHAHLLVTPESSKAISALFRGIEAIKFRMEQQGLTQKDFDPYIGSSDYVSERNGLSLLYCPIG